MQECDDVAPFPISPICDLAGISDAEEILRTLRILWLADISEPVRNLSTMSILFPDDLREIIRRRYGRG